MTPVQGIIPEAEPIQVQQASITDRSPSRTLVTPMGTVEAKIRAKFGTHGEEAVKVAKCESGLNSQAIGDLHLDNGTNPSYGLFQIRYFAGSRGSVEQLLDLDYNINKAYEMSNGGTNWQPWSCKK